MESGEIPESKQGKYIRTGVLWTSEELNKKASIYIRDSANVMGKPNLTVGRFCQWARKWMRELGFDVVAKKKGTYVDGHEREDVKYHQTFL